MSRKKRILFTGEASYLSTGFATYSHEVIKRLFATNKYEIAEMGSYAHDGDPRNRQVPWKFYPVGPDINDKRAYQIYMSNSENQFGKWRFEDVCLDFKPDIVYTITDFWMMEFLLKSPFRNYYKLIAMPTVDGIPQRDLWLEGYNKCDKVLTYSQWGYDVLKNSGKPTTPLVAVASPGVDLDVFKPVANKRQHKQNMGIDPNCIIVGTVMRNQRRKLYYDLIEAFSDWIYKNKSKSHLELTNRTFLYLHTSYPDQGWDIGRAVREFKVSNKVLMTYLCDKCLSPFVSFFAGELTHCPRCKELTAHTPNAGKSLGRESLAAVMNTFDLYVQYSVCEGYGMPIMDSQSCGVPTMAVRYSAMEDHLKNPTSIPIEVGRFFYEGVMETEQKRALPNNQDFVEKLNNFVKLSEEKRNELGEKTRAYIEREAEVYGTEEKLPFGSWDRTAKIWENVFDECEIHDPNQTWLNKKPNLITSELNGLPQNMNNRDFVKWCIINIFQDKNLLNSEFEKQWVTNLNRGFFMDGHFKKDITRNGMISNFLEMIKSKNEIELKRVNFVTSPVSEELSYKIV